MALGSSLGQYCMSPFVEKMYSYSLLLSEFESKYNFSLNLDLSYRIHSVLIFLSIYCDLLSQSLLEIYEKCSQYLACQCESRVAQYYLL